MHLWFALEKASQGNTGGPPCRAGAVYEGLVRVTAGGIRFQTESSAACRPPRPPVSLSYHNRVKAEMTKESSLKEKASQCNNSDSVYMLSCSCCSVHEVLWGYFVFKNHLELSLFLSKVGALFFLLCFAFGLCGSIEKTALCPIGACTDKASLGAQVCCYFFISVRIYS